ncbi:MAG: RecBCD enzyme subunit RecC [Verrucomicrobiota bacterium]|jgi:exodeoxyribonuclease V gamma subunit
MLFLAETPGILLQTMAEALCAVRDPRARHWLILPGRGRTERLQQQWARLSGIASHSQEVEIRELIEQAAAGDLGRFDFESLRFAIAKVLPEFRDCTDFPVSTQEPLEPISASALQWATSLAKAVDDALLCRPRARCWEADSFLEKLTQHPLVSEVLRPHLGCVSPEAFALASRQWMETWQRRGGLPHLWILLDAGLPAVQFERLIQLSEALAAAHPERLHLFALSPSLDYWADCRLRGRRVSSVSGSDPEWHPGGLLWALGRCSQDLQRQLADTFLAFGEGGIALPSPPPVPNLLGRLQSSCRRAQPLPPEARPVLLPEDASLSVHSARSTLRELEICRDRILQARSEIPDLRYEEILLLLADPKRQAPFVEAAFRVEDFPQGSLPFRLLGFGQTVPSVFGESLLLLIEKLRGRLSLEDLQILIENPLIAARFGLDESDSDPQELINWLRDAQFRWGFDGCHRAEFQPFEEARWNLGWALQRLGLGALVAAEARDSVLRSPEGPWETVALERASGLSLNALARLSALVHALAEARPLWTQKTAQSLSVWIRHLLQIVETFLECESGPAAAHFSKLSTSVLPSLMRADRLPQCPLTAEAFLRLLSEKLASLAESGARGGGGICVADLRQYAGVPARMVLVAGLNDGTFPRKDDRPEWHPLARASHTGDPSVRDADRHALLLAVLSAGDRLVLSYQGGSDDDAEEIPPSTALADLCQAVDGECAHLPGYPAPHEVIRFTHPLNGFSPRAFLAESSAGARNTSRADYEAALLLSRPLEAASARGLWRESMPPPGPAPSSLALSELRKLLKEPARIFLEGLGIRLPEETASLDGSDHLEADGLAGWEIRSRLLPPHVEGLPLEPLLDRLEKSGLLPRAQIGQRILEAQRQKLPPTPEPPLRAEERLSGVFRVALQSPRYRPGEACILEGRLSEGWYRTPGAPEAVWVSASKKSLKTELTFTLDALMLRASETEATCASPLRSAIPLFSQSEASDNSVLRLGSAEQSRALLAKMLRLHELACTLPLPFWPGTAEAIEKRIAKAAKTGQTVDASLIDEALAEGWKSWSREGSDGSPAARNSPATQYAFRGCLNPLDWTPPTPLPDWLPEPGFPLAWRVHRFVLEWLRECRSLP